MSAKPGDFAVGQRVRWLSHGEYRGGAVAKLGRKYVKVSADTGALLTLYPSALQPEEGSRA